MQEPDCVDIEVFVGVDIAKGDHYACVVTSAGAEVLARSVRNDEAAIGRLIDDAAVHGAVALVIDTTSSAASLLLETAARREVPVAYVTGLAMRRAADLYAGACGCRKLCRWWSGGISVLVDETVTAGRFHDLEVSI